MNVFDFDNTIYDGDSTKDFYLFCLKKQPSLLYHLPHQICAVSRYLLRRADKTHTKEACYCFLSSLRDIDRLIEEFWDTHQKKIRDWYFTVPHEPACIISASPEFLLKPVCQRLGVAYLIASLVDKKTGTYQGLNCSGDEKIRRYQEQFPDTEITAWYFDSDSDLPFAGLAKTAYRVSKGKVSKWHP